VNRHRLVTSAVTVVLTVAGFTSAGCQTGTRSDSRGAADGAAGANSGELREAILASGRAFSQTSSRVVLKHGLSTIGASLDPTRKSAALSETETDLTIGVIWVSPDVWLKYDLGGGVGRQLGIDPNKWMHVDVSRLTNLPRKLLINVATTTGDPFNLADLLDGLLTVRRTDPTHYAGTIDLTRTRGPVAFPEAQTKTIGDQSRSVPFSAVLDAQGRLTYLKIDASAAMSQLVTEITITDYGVPQTITKPTATEVATAPPALYGLLNT
jgi:hypothetical protein